METRMIREDRVVEILTEGKWEEKEFKDLKKGDVFRLFDLDSNGNKIQVESKEGVREFKAINDSYIGVYGVYEVECSDIEGNVDE